MAKAVGTLILTLQLVLSVLFFGSSNSWAKDLSLLADFKYTTLQAKTSGETGDVGKTDSQQFTQLYSLKLNKQLYPNLLLRTGGIFQTSHATGHNEGQPIDSRARMTQPYLEGILQTPLYGVDLSYRTSRIENTTSGLTISDTLKQYSARMNYRPIDLPRLGIEYIHTLAYDAPRTTDSVDDLFSLTSRYSYQKWDFDFSHTSENHNERIGDSRTQTLNDNGKVAFSNSFLQRKLTVDATVQANRSAIQFSGGGTQLLQTTPVGTGFFSLQDPIPEEDLAGVFTTVDASHPFSTVNLGRGGGSSPLSVGLYFGQPTTLDKLQMLLVTNEQNSDVATPGQIAGIAQQFSWRVFVSDDQLTWTEQTVSQATYNVFDNRFEINIQSTRARYVKIVTVPLYLAAPGEIRVANLTAYVSLPTGKKTKIISTSGNLTGGVTWKISDDTSLRYDLFLQQQTSQPYGNDQTQLSDGVSFLHRLSPVFSTRGRYLRTDSWQSGGNGYAENSYSAGITGRYLDTFYQNLSYSGTRTQEPEGNSTSNAVVLRSYLDLYQGWSLVLDQGYSRQNRAQSGRDTTFFLRGSTRLVPNNKMNVNIDYTVSWGTQATQGNTRRQSGRINTFLLPFETLSLDADVSFSDSRGGGEQEYELLQNYSANWSPFREGTLQLSLLYNQSQLAQNQKSTSFSPIIKWQITRNALLNLTYTIGDNQGLEDRTHFKSLYAELLVNY